MTEIDQVKSANPQPATRRDFVKKWAEEGMIEVQIDATFFGLMTPKNMEDAGETALSVGVVPEINEEAVPESVQQAGHSELIIKGGIPALIKPDQLPENVLQRLPDHSLLHIFTARGQQSLAQAPRVSILGTHPNSIKNRGQIRLVARIFSTQPKPDNLVKGWFDTPKEIEPAA